MALPPHPPEPDDSDDITIADEEWPVAEQYRVEPPPQSARGGRRHDRHPAGHRRRRGPSAASLPISGRGSCSRCSGSLLIVVLIPAGIWLAGRDDDESAASPPRGHRRHDNVRRRPRRRPRRLLPQPPFPSSPASRSRRRERCSSRKTFACAYDVSRRIAPSDEVLEQSPAPGERLSADTVVVLTVSRASAPEQVTVPRVEGLLTSEATSLLRQAGLDVEIRDHPLVTARGNGRQPESRAGRGGRSADDRRAGGSRPVRRRSRSRFHGSSA